MSLMKSEENYFSKETFKEIKKYNIYDERSK